MPNRRMPMTNRRVSIPAIVAVPALVVLLCCPLARGQDELEALVSQLPTNNSVRNDVELEKRIADLGPLAVPALEKELRLGIRFETLNKLLQSGGSRRLAVVSVLTQIPGKDSTDLLVRSLADPPDCLGMTEITLQALSQRPLSNDQVVALLENHEPRIVLAGIEHAVGKMAVPEIKGAVERVFDRNMAASQFKNEYGAPTAGPDALWAVRLAAGQVLNRDMIPERRTRTQEILADLKREALHPSKPDTPVLASYSSQAEITICGCLDKLAALGPPVQDLVEDAAKAAAGDHAKVLDMALARLGDRARVTKVMEHLTSTDNHTVRFCAAVTLRKLHDRSSIPALRKALRDPYQRVDGSCVRTGDGIIYPIRIVAADALVDLGEDPKEVWAEMRK